MLEILYEVELLEVLEIALGRMEIVLELLGLEVHVVEVMLVLVVEVKIKAFLEIQTRIIVIIEALQLVQLEELIMNNIEIYHK